jgi:hypothetical protein
MQTIQNTIIGTLETVKTKLEERDESVLKRAKVFADEGEADKKSLAAGKGEKRVVKDGDENNQ